MAVERGSPRACLKRRELLESVERCAEFGMDVELGERQDGSNDGCTVRYRERDLVLLEKGLNA